VGLQETRQKHHSVQAAAAVSHWIVLPLPSSAALPASCSTTALRSTGLLPVTCCQATANTHCRWNQ
jgi:hypothetical protein